MYTRKERQGLWRAARRLATVLPLGSVALQEMRHKHIPSRCVDTFYCVGAREGPLARLPVSGSPSLSAPIYGGSSHDKMDTSTCWGCLCHTCRLHYVTASLPLLPLRPPPSATLDSTFSFILIFSSCCRNFPLTLSGPCLLMYVIRLHVYLVFICRS